MKPLILKNSRNAESTHPNTIFKRVALVGAANSGKTTLFNLLTDSHYTTVNYPGATVEYALAKLRLPSNQNLEVMDTPGISSLAAASKDERVTVDALFTSGHELDLILAVVDATQLTRHLYVVHQLRQSGFRMALVVTMNDLLLSQGYILDVIKLSSFLDAPVLAIDPRNKASKKKLVDFVTETYSQGENHVLPLKEVLESIDENSVSNTYAWLDEVQSKCVTTQKLKDSSETSSDETNAAISGEAGAATSRYQFHRLDRILLHPVYGLAIFIFSMCAMFTAIFWFAIPFMDGIDSAFGWLIEFTKTSLPKFWLVDLVADGLLGGVGAVAVFLPQIVILFFLMGYLEDSGYLARGAALVDKPLSKIGLNGKSFVPLLSGYACAIPAILAARTIPNRFERALTIFIIPLMSCSARLPVYTLLIAFLTPHDKPWIGGLSLAALYFFGLFMGAVVSSLVSRMLRSKRGESDFVLELPAIRRPLLRIILSSTYHKASQYVQKAGMTIVIISVGLWIFTHLPIVSQSEATESSDYIAVSHSYAAQVGHFIEPVMKPLGLDWRAGVAMMSAFAAREVFVSALALMYRIEDSDADGVADRLLATMHTATIGDTGQAVFTFSSVLGIIIFFMIALQCFPTVAVAKKEFGNWRLALVQLFVFTGTAYLLSALCVQGLRALGYS